MNFPLSSSFSKLLLQLLLKVSLNIAKIENTTKPPNDLEDLQDDPHFS